MKYCVFQMLPPAETQATLSERITSWHATQGHVIRGPRQDPNSSTTPNKKYKCSKCDLPFATRAGLRSHTMVKHSDSYQYQCPFCYKGLSATNQFRSHLKKHGGTGFDFYCSLCGGSFEKVVDFMDNVRNCLAQKSQATASQESDT